MKIFRNNILLILLAITFLFLTSCEYDGPAKVWDADATGADAPEITSIDPPAAAFGGWTRIKISGKNFSPNLDENFVYFGNGQAQVISASANELVVVAPTMENDTLTIKVITEHALTFATHKPYKLKNVTIPYASFGTLLIDAIEVDNSENLYACLNNNTIFKISPDGSKSEFGYTTFRVTQARYGIDGNLFLQRDQSPIVYTLPATGGTAVEYITQNQRKKMVYFDFNEQKTAYFGGKTTFIFSLTPDKTYATWTGYYGATVNSLRVFDGYVYVILVDNKTAPSKGVWRNKILDDNIGLGPDELVLDWAETGVYADNDLNDMTFASNGDLLVATNNTNPILVIHPDKTMEPLYPGLLMTNAKKIVWGNERFLYMTYVSEVDGSVSIHRVEMEQDGAPYYGR